MIPAQQNALDALNSANAILSTFILTNTAVPGTPTWKLLQQALGHQNDISAKINAIIGANFKEAPPTALSNAVQRLQQVTQRLRALDQTVNSVGQVVDIANTIVQTATSILALV